MNIEILNEHLETLAGHVFDNDKLITYKWLSKKLHVHVNIAKQILWNFYQKYRSGNNIECTYLLIGQLSENGMHVEVVRYSDVSKAKEKYSKIISEHVYSVHKPITDLQLLATADSGDVKYSAIKFDTKMRSDEEIQLLRWGTAAKKDTMENISDFKSIDSINLSMLEKNTTKKILPQRNNSVKKGSLDNFFGKLTFPLKSAEVTSSEKKNNAKKEFIEEKIIGENKNLLGKKRIGSEEIDEIAKKQKKTITQNSNNDSEIQIGVEMEDSFPEKKLKTLVKPKNLVSKNKKDKEQTKKEKKEAAIIGISSNRKVEQCEIEYPKYLSMME
ncbi:PREDICTED: DNA polymerase delta subunit 3-like [Cyphomyrmex costatus]|uniref:DNA polymerase delta subunit 3-like n=1 Tax=Cyphomyrmex costatus TaxID=456900 RepID=UPI0008523218|nr:PREDICTED: DNA polymerase delta subunit 3-like [Cyphomyrmex costatus]